MPTERAKLERIYCAEAVTVIDLARSGGSRADLPP